MADVHIARSATSGLLPMWQKGFIGSLGGLAAVVTKLLALDAVVLSTLLSADEFTKAASLKAMIFIQAPLLMFLGAVIACMMDESVRMKVFAIGVSAPALIAPWLAQPVAGLPTNKAAEIEAFSFHLPLLRTLRTPILPAE
ncbi:hypothetical protein P6U16_00060 [Rhizobium sp. 32-5/1]|uniref:hypothetical protein n=1 Tax=Rhizobium sp. 32-5/1 TaxID=3019602 RepID=UPI00240D48CF|nr:hypothetical protein [Rhizobium sp. 32-5/1]WEZ83341.1 hypothetical protein P6U16_00060 [Rhizobium sp. 32-5/1]